MSQRYAFGEFELDLDAHQLRRNGQPVRAERRPFDLLVMLVQRNGRLVSRDEIVAALWPDNVIIDFESGLNTLVRKVRIALGDSPDQPRFIETVPGRGYRFIAPVTTHETAAPQSALPVPAPRFRRNRIALLTVLAVAVASAAVFLWHARERQPEPLRIAVLPFENLSGDETLGYMATGIADDINTSLAQIDLPNLSVIGFVSARAMAGSASLSDIEAELGVDYVVLSSLRLDRSRIRITSRLVRVADNEQIWSASFDRELTNLLGLQRELSVAIAEQIRQRLSPAVAAAIEQRHSENPAAYELYLKGRFEWTRFQPDSIARALDYYRQAVEKDPRYALAWAGIAHALITSPVTVGANRNTVLPAATDALQRAVEFGGNLAETQLALGSFHYFLEGDVLAAETAARRAVALDPNSAMAHMFLGIVLATLEKHVEARAMLRRARELDPLFPLMFANSAVVALMADEPMEAMELATQAIAINPEFWVGYQHLGTARLEVGDAEGALQAFTEARKLAGNGSARIDSSRAIALVRLGRVDEARDILEELIDRSTERDVPPYYIAVIYVELGETDNAFEWLDRGLATQNLPCLNLEADPRLEPLKRDVRFGSLLSRCRSTRTPG